MKNFPVVTTIREEDDYCVINCEHNSSSQIICSKSYLENIDKEIVEKMLQEKLWGKYYKDCSKELCEQLFKLNRVSETVGMQGFLADRTEIKKLIEKIVKKFGKIAKLKI